VSIEKAATELRQALAHLPFDLLMQAASDFDEARTILAATSQGTSRPEAGVAIQALGQAISGVVELHGTASKAKETIETYLADIAGGERTGSAASAPRAATPVPRSPSAPGRRPAVDQELVAELVRQGTKITPEKVVRIARDREGRAVWMEEGTERSGLAHLMAPGRVVDFVNKGVEKDSIVDLVFTALAKGEPIGITSSDRVVYAVSYQGRPHRVAITVANNGYIVGANPVGLTRRIKPLP
jgi:hypothetical protein